MPGHKRLPGTLILFIALVTVATGLSVRTASASGPGAAASAMPGPAGWTVRPMLASAQVNARLATPLATASVWTAAEALLAANRPARIDLYTPGIFVSQTNLVQCVGASMQMMLNMIDTTHDQTATTQHRLFELAVATGNPTSQYAGGTHGASAQGWAAGLTAAGAGLYTVRSAPTLQAALALAAAAIVETGRPVGLLMWQGAHAWVMSGFEATADPAIDPSARVTAVRVLDPLYPRPVGAPWAPGPSPDARLSVAQIGRAFVPYRPHGRNAALRNQFVLVLPLQPSVTSMWPLPV